MSTFTALNGNDSQTIDKQSGSPVSRPAESEERGGTATSHERRTSAEAPSNTRQHWTASNTERTAYQANDYAMYEGNHKRKRSMSTEPRREGPGSPEERNPSSHHPDSREAFGTHLRDRDHRVYGKDSRDESSSWYSQSQSQRDGRSTYESHSQGASISTPADEQPGDGYRGPGMADPGMLDPQEYSPTSPDDGDDSAYYGGPFDGDHRRAGAVQSDPKKRKRNFSNRTKTGCLTCRKRKKKCDELKPECRSRISRDYTIDLLNIYRQQLYPRWLHLSGVPESARLPKDGNQVRGCATGIQRPELRSSRRLWHAAGTVNLCQPITASSQT